MGNVKIGFDCYFIADIMTKYFWKCLLSGPLPNIHVYFLSKWLSGQPKGSFCEKIIKKSTPQKLYGG